MPNKSKIASFECARVLALIAVISIHCQLFMDYGFVNGEPWLNYITNQLARFAVPLFFLIAGYLIYPKLNEKPYQTTKAYTLPLMLIWVIWSAIYLVLPFNLAVVAEHGYLAERQGYWNYLLQSPLNSVFEGGLVHLWFIPSLALAVLMIAWFVDNKCRSLLLPFAAIFYVHGLMAGSYLNITEIETPIFSRNGPFFSFLMVAIGFEVRRREWSITSTQAVVLALFGMLLHFFEAFYLNSLGQVFNMNDFLLGTVFWSTGIFFWLLNHPNLGNHKVWHDLAKWVLPIYVVHLLVTIYMNNIAGMLGATQWTRDLIVFFGTLFGSYLLVILLEKTPLAFKKLRGLPKPITPSSCEPQ
ncbi:acyltransferase [Vibrio mediterranei]|uniref:acyltransferase n=1 Tax=Vibrio mediterranei TaxID=689 RepID=UPI001EFE3744|nr:acyltransferase family protein [Vibrio mediterranei]MCG9658800.1 acyltransferase family protein [Vibrio mediterranei]